MDPGKGQKTAHFSGIVGEPVIPAGADEPQRFDVDLQGAVGGLKDGDKVTLRGFPVGEVKQVAFRLDAKSGNLSTSVTLALYPSLFHLKVSGTPPTGSAPLRAAIEALIKQGLRARLQRDPPIIGEYRVALDIMPDAASTAADPPKDGSALPQIPSAPDDSLDTIISRINKVPVDRIAQNVLTVTRQVKELVSSPELAHAVTQLDAALTQIHETAAQSGPRITRLIDALHHTAADLDRAAKSADKVAGGGGAQNDLKKTMREVTEAARAIRELADYLDRHPEAIIHGRSGG